MLQNGGDHFAMDNTVLSFWWVEWSVLVLLLVLPNLPSLGTQSEEHGSKGFFISCLLNYAWMSHF